ncbi:hypothetical protein MRX96_054235 [Rhipicephalus microplus]
MRHTGDYQELEYVESSEAEGRDSLSLRECRDAYRSGKYLESRPWMLHVLRFSTILVVGRRRRQDAILMRVASLSVDTEAAGCIDRSIRVNMCSTACGFVTHFPFFILTVSLVQVATFAYHCAVPSCSESTQDRQLCQLPCNTSLIFNPRKRRELWRFLTYSLVHDGFLHLGSNVFLQIAFAFPLEVVHSWWPIMLVYRSVLPPDGALGTRPKQHTRHGTGRAQNSDAASRLLERPVLDRAGPPKTAMASFLSYAGHYGGALAGLVVGLPVLNSAQRKRSDL